MNVFGLDWFRFVPVESDMTTYFKNNDNYDCTWDELGTIIKDDQ